MSTNNNTCIISCIFGPNFSTVYHAPTNYTSFLFTNNNALIYEIKKKGWQYIFIDMPLIEDLAVSSIQSKYIKFLQFMNNNEYILPSNYKYILYTDHKLEIKNEHIEYLISISNKPITIRKHNDTRSSIYDEFNAAMKQERYARYRNETLKYIYNKIYNGYHDTDCILLTGLILYNMLYKESIFTFVNEVYDDILAIQSPECQIVASLVATKYMNIIQVINSSTLEIKWLDPDCTDARRCILKNLRQRIKKHTI